MLCISTRDSKKHHPVMFSIFVVHYLVSVYVVYLVYFYNASCTCAHRCFLSNICSFGQAVQKRFFLYRLSKDTQHLKGTAYLIGFYMKIHFHLSNSLFNVLKWSTEKNCLRSKWCNVHHRGLNQISESCIQISSHN